MKSDFLLVPSAAFGLAFFVLLVRAGAADDRELRTEEIAAAQYELTPKQAQMHARGVPLDVVVSLPPECDADVDLGREFPVVVSCPEVP